MQFFIGADFLRKVIKMKLSTAVMNVCSKHFRVGDIRFDKELGESYKITAISYLTKTYSLLWIDDGRVEDNIYKIKCLYKDMLVEREEVE